MDTYFFKDKKLPFVECRITKESVKHYKAHFHDTLSIGALIGSKVLYTVEDRKNVFKPGSLAIINPLTIHSCNPINNKKRSYYMLYLDIEWCKKIQKSIFDNNKFIRSYMDILSDKDIYEEYIYVMNFFVKKGYDIMEKEQRLINLIAKIFKKVIPKDIRSETNISFDILRVKDILSKDLDKTITLEELSKTVAINPYTLLRKFKNEIGCTPHNFRLNKRVEFAKRLLQKGEEISIVALECGFYDQTHFQKYFKALTTLTPKEYQKNYV